MLVTVFERTLESVRTLKVNGVREDVRAVDCFRQLPNGIHDSS